MKKKLVNVNNLTKIMKEKTSFIFNKALKLEDYFVNFFYQIKYFNCFAKKLPIDRYSRVLREIVIY